MAASLTSPRSARHASLRVRWRAVAVGLSALLSVWLFTAASTAQIQRGREVRAQAQVAMATTQMEGRALGGAFLSDATTTASLSATVLNALYAVLDPLNPKSALYEVRKSMETLASMLLIPIVLVAIVFAMFTSAGQFEERLADIGKRLLIVLFLLWSYPLWDRALFGISVQITKALNSPEAARQVLASAALNQTATGGQRAVSFGANVTQSPTELVASFAQNDLACAVEVSTASPDDASAGGNCFADSVPSVLRAAHATSMAAQASGTQQQRAQALAERMPGDRNNNYSEALADKTGDKGWLARTWDATTNLGATVASYVTDSISGMLASTVPGILMFLQQIITSVVLWFMWVGVIVARSFSLALAPLPIAFSLWPSQSNKANSWFAGHARMVFKPIGLSFGILVYLALFSAIMSSSAVPGLVGLGVKIAMFAMLMVVLFKGQALTDVASGDVTKVAEGIGNGIRNQTVAVAGTALKAGVSGAAAGAGKVAGVVSRSRATSASGSNLASRAASALDARTGGRAGPMLSAFQERFKLARQDDSSLLNRTKRGVKSVTKGSMDVARFAWKNRVTGESAQSPTGALKTAFVEPVLGMRQTMTEQLAKSRGEGLAPMAPAVKQDLATRATRAEDRAADVQRYGLKPELRTTDNLTTDEVAKRTMVQATSDKLSTLTDASRVARELDTQLGANGMHLNVTPKNVDGKQVAALDPESASQLVSLFRTDAALGEHWNSAARNIGIDLRSVPRIGADGSRIPAGTAAPTGEPVWVDPEWAVANVPQLADAVVMAKQLGEGRQDELVRREKVSKLGKSERDSVKEFALRHLDPALAERQVVGDREESDDEMAARLDQEAMRTLRMAWYLRSSATERQRFGLAPALTIDELSQLGDTTQGRQQLQSLDASLTQGQWLAKESATGLGNAEFTSLQATVEHENARYQAMAARRVLSGGEHVGLDLERYGASGRQEVRYSAKPGSLYQAVLEKELAKMPLPGSGLERPSLEQLRQEGRLPADFDEQIYAQAQQDALALGKVPPKDPAESHEQWVTRVQDQINQALFTA